MKRKLTPAERKYYERVAELGCIVPHITGKHADCGGRIELHHPTGAGMGLRSSNYDVISLCTNHHSAQTPLKHGHAIHKGTQSFEANYGTQMELVGKVKELLGHEDVGI